LASARFWRRYRLIAALVAAGLLLWTYRVLTVWNDRPTVFLFGLAGLFALLLLLDWVFDIVGPPVWRLLRSLAVSVGRAVARDPQLTALLDRHPDLRDWLRARLTLKRWTGFYLTATVLLALYFLAGFLSVLRDVLTATALALYDPQIAALLRAFRTEAVTRVMWLATVFGDPNSMWMWSLLFVLLLVLWGRKAEAVLVAVTMSLGSAMGDFFKVLTRRPRPPIPYALINQPGSKSFPSGHALASALFFALLAFVLWRTVGKTPRRRFAIVVLCAFGAFTVALSRVYLGVHWPTDVLGSWYLAAALATVAIGTFLMWERYGGATKRWPVIGTRRVRLAVTFGVVAVAAAVLVVGTQRDPLLKTLVAPPPPVAYSSARLPALEKALPRFTEKLDGSPEEPVSLVFVGTQTQLEAAFAKAGWDKADHQSIAALVRVSVAALADSPYPTAPVTPAFIGGKPNDLAFEKSEGVASARRRHHARFWETNLLLDGKPVWVGTASFDDRLEIGSALPFPTHHIAPAIDMERDLVVRELLATKLAVQALRIQLVPPEAGTNAAGDKFFTDGKADLLQAR
jgi:undecaprenyl-diphosphatase